MHIQERLSSYRWLNMSKTNNKRDAGKERGGEKEREEQTINVITNTICKCLVHNFADDR